MKILVLCTGNSCRSQMMHGYLDHFSDDSVEVVSAGVETHGVNPFAIGVMAEDGVFIHNHTSNHVDEYLGSGVDVVITVCDHAKTLCPIFPEKTKVVHHPFSDPSGLSGDAKLLIKAFRATRDEIKEFAREFVMDLSV